MQEQEQWIKEHGFLEADFGDGWISKRALTMAQIAVAFGGFDVQEVKRRLFRAGNPSRVMNIATVGRVLGEIKSEFDEGAK